ncbi:MAG: ABC transporter substrate-binding protein [Desulfarculaceae bacterium]|nr:ABC transporter substrate-binding protein [Desulfarculaceae bacterium]MCF8074351.1 ABC transporter substrate-binding protein [Desulfarculaceae bacterium]MCF8103549.1 ABC transporter substrate-binding protein [Desulfarculaceae bacterium]MCF8117316.1 ABC transporter substrate-binding protein [Desulfarculaceae bacterium]
MALPLLALGLILAATPARAQKDIKAKTAPEEITLQLKWRHQFQFAGYYAAIEKGFYRQAGLKVRLLEAKEGVEPAEVVLGGRAQYGIATSDLVLLRSQGKPVVALAAIYQHSPLVLLTLARQGIETVHDLAGKTLAMEPHAAELLAYLEKEGLQLSDLKIVSHGFDVQALLQGKVTATSAYSTDEPFELKKAGVACRLFSPRSGGIDFYGDTLFTTEQELASHPGRVARFLEATRRGWRYALANSGEIIDLILAEYSKRHTRQHLTFEADRSRKLILPGVVEIGYMNPGRWRHIAEVYAYLKMMPPDFDLSGFIHDPHPKPNLLPLYLILGGALLLSLTVGAVSWRFYKLNRAMAESEEKLKLILDASPLGASLTRYYDGTNIYVNSALAGMYMGRRQDLVGQMANQYYADQKDLAWVIGQLQQKQSVTNHEMEMVRVDGSTVWCQINMVSTWAREERVILTWFNDVSERRRARDRLQYMASHDSLTGLPNRRSFEEFLDNALARAKRQDANGCLLYLDLDGFKQINDRMGHHIGDLLLENAAKRLKDALRKGDFLARLGGDEFAVVIERISDQQSPEEAARRILEVLQAPYELEGKRVAVGVSIGLARFGPEPLDMDRLRKMADSAMYRAKKEGKGRFCRFEDQPELES